jgi:hypothetical protein
MPAGAAHGLLPAEILNLKIRLKRRSALLGPGIDKEQRQGFFPDTFMIPVLLAILALALAFIVYLKSTAAKDRSPITREPENARSMDTVTPSQSALSVADSEKAYLDSQQSTSEAESVAAGNRTDSLDIRNMQVSLRGDQAVTPATPTPAPAVLPPDNTTDISPLERRTMDAMQAASEQFPYMRQGTVFRFIPRASITTSSPPRVSCQGIRSSLERRRCRCSKGDSSLRRLRCRFSNFRPCSSGRSPFQCSFVGCGKPCWSADKEKWTVSRCSVTKGAL